MDLSQPAGAGDDSTVFRHGDDDRRAALLQLLERLRRDDYTFVTATPSTHARVVARPDRRQARDLRDALGWSLPFAPDIVPGPCVDLLNQAGMLVRREDGLLAANVRVSAVRGGAVPAFGLSDDRGGLGFSRPGQLPFRRPDRRAHG